MVGAGAALVAMGAEEAWVATGAAGSRSFAKTLHHWWPHFTWSRALWLCSPPRTAQNLQLHSRMIAQPNVQSHMAALATEESPACASASLYLQWPGLPRSTPLVCFAAAA